jgi:hypothetical protein
METDEFPDPQEGLPRGIFEYNGNDTPLGPEYGALRELMASDDPEIARAAAAELAECYRGSNIRSGIGADRLFSEAEAEEQQPLPGRMTASGMRLFTDEDGQVGGSHGCFLLSGFWLFDSQQAGCVCGVGNSCATAELPSLPFCDELIIHTNPGPEDWFCPQRRPTSVRHTLALC